MSEKCLIPSEKLCFIKNALFKNTFEVNSIDFICFVTCSSTYAAPVNKVELVDAKFICDMYISNTNQFLAQHEAILVFNNRCSHCAY